MDWHASLSQWRRLVALNVAPLGLAAPFVLNAAAQAPRAAPPDAEALPAGGEVRDGRSGRGAVPPELLPPTAERQISLDASRRHADRLARSSQEAFHRGLLPLRHYLEQSALVQRTELRLAEAGFDGNVTRVRAAQVARMRSALRRLEQLQQPNARHWEADVALSQWALADAELELARATEDGAAADALRRRRSGLAATHERIRERDAEFGWASLDATTYARSLTVAAAEDDGVRPSRAAEYRDYLTRVAEQTSRWSEDGAGIGRDDRVRRAVLRPVLNDLSSALQSGEHDRAAELLDQAHRGFRQSFSHQEELQSRGTASIYDLSRTWLEWRDVQDRAAEQPGLLDNGQIAERNEGLARLSRLADRTTDLRGRRAADVSVVRLLEHVDRLESDSLRSARPGGTYAR
jgi:hypothetical protein